MLLKHFKLVGYEHKKYNNKYNCSLLYSKTRGPWVKKYSPLH